MSVAYAALLLNGGFYMVIKIQTQQTGIPVELGELKFYFDTSDESINNLSNSHQKVVDEISEVQDGDEASAKVVLQKGFDLLLGEGAFKKIYKQTPSIIQCTKQLLELSEAIKEELSSMGKVMSQQEKAQQYLRNKGKSKKKKK